MALEGGSVFREPNDRASSAAALDQGSMCFSAVASFSTGGLTGVIGVVALSRVTQRRELPLAAMPLMFGLQQAIEGSLWLVLPTAPRGPLEGMLALMFMLLAQVVWPVYAPLAALSLEPERGRRRLMLACLAVGAAISGFLLWRLLSGPHEAAIVNRCIVYRTRGGQPLLIGALYLCATSLPLILSSRRTIVALGAITLAGCVIAYIFYWEAFQSVWCFFAGVASAVILGHFVWIRPARLRAALAAACALRPGV